MKLSIPIIHTRRSNPICSLREKISTNNHTLWRGQYLVHCKPERKFEDYFIRSKTFIAKYPFIYAGNKLYLHKKTKLLLITNINHKLGESVREGAVSEPTCQFQYWQDKKNIWKLLKKLQTLLQEYGFECGWCGFNSDYPY